MSNEQETIADIVAEMRNESHAGDESCLEWVGEKMRTRADRIEAAAKREREATREKPSQVGNAAKMREAKESDMNPINPVCRPATENEINYGEAKWCAICTSECDSKGKDELVMCDYFKTNDNDPIVPGCPSLMPHALTGGFDSVAPAEEGTPMNAAKMREALSDACYAMFNFLKTQNGGYEEMAKALDKAKAALAAPPRNCDVGTAEEQQDRFREFCRRHFDARECGLGRSVAKCPAYQGGKNPDCSLWWAQMPYEEGGAK